jgi:uncharacterized protein (TIGR00255 family)
MTGFGAATRVIHLEGGTPHVLGVELRSVNQRFLEFKARQPFGVAAEQELRRAAEARLGRGRVDLLVHLQPVGAGSETVGLDRVRLAQVLGQVRELTALASSTGVELAPVNGLELLRFIGTQRGAPTTAAEAPQEAPPELVGVMAEALDGLCNMREREGAALTEVLAALASELEQHAEGLRASLAGEAERLQDRLTEKIAALCVRGGVSPPSPERIAQEVAALVQRGDIEEELARLASHLGQLRGVLAAPATVGQGKTLDFLSQELFREITTIGSKITSHAGSAVVIAAKSTVERMREQVQNVE